jgi:hypothetical protein
MGTPFPTVISFATEQYAGHLERLVRSLEGFGLPHHVVQQKSRGSWVSNCNLKPAFIAKELVTREAPVLWLDADAEVVQYPALFEGPDFDFAVCNRPTLGFGSGTLYFGPRALYLAALWQELAIRSPEQWDQRLLQQAWQDLESLGLPPRTYWLPETYLQKIDHPEGAVILQHQASRELKGKIR